MCTLRNAGWLHVVQQPKFSSQCPGSIPTAKRWGYHKISFNPCFQSLKKKHTRLCVHPLFRHQEFGIEPEVKRYLECKQTTLFTFRLFQLGFAVSWNDGELKILPIHDKKGRFSKQINIPGFKLWTENCEKKHAMYTIKLLDIYHISTAN